MLRIGRGFAVSASWLGVTVQPVTVEDDSPGLDDPHRRLHREVDLVGRAQLAHVDVERRQRFRDQTLARLDNRDVHSAASVAAQDLAERLHALELAPDDHHPRGLPALGEPFEAPADAVALIDGLEGMRVLDDTANAPPSATISASKPMAVRRRVATLRSTGSISVTGSRRNLWPA
jgi:hypothetical protein